MVGNEDVRSPLAWLGVAILGVWLYLISKLLSLWASHVASATGLPYGDVVKVLAATAGLGSILVLAGLTAALWRANLAAGLASAGVVGLVLGAAGLGVLVLFEAARAADLLQLRVDQVAALLRAQDVGDVVGNALAFGGLAGLAIGLATSAGLFQRAEEKVAAPVATTEKRMP